MAATEERKQQERRRRTERQRELRRQDRQCGNCGEQADGGLIDWAGRNSPLRIPICVRCRDRLEGQLPMWSELQSYGVWCPVDSDRPCADCTSGAGANRPKRGVLSRLLGR